MFILETGPFWNVTCFCEGKPPFWPKITHGYLICSTPGLSLSFSSISYVTGLNHYKREVMLHLRTPPIFRGKPKPVILTKFSTFLRLWDFPLETALFWCQKGLFCEGKLSFTTCCLFSWVTTLGWPPILIYAVLWGKTRHLRKVVTLSFLPVLESD